MSRKTIPISTRFSPEDAEFIAQWEGDGAKTPSEKLRGIIAEARRNQSGTEDYAGSLHLTTSLLASTLHIIRRSEHAHGVHSALLIRVGEWLPECMAFLMSSNGDDETLDHDDLVRIEKALADRVMNLMQSVLQLAVTRTGPCYDPQVIRSRIEPVLELAEVVSGN